MTFTAPATTPSARALVFPSFFLSFSFLSFSFLSNLASIQYTTFEHVDIVVGGSSTVCKSWLAGRRSESASAVIRRTFAQRPQIPASILHPLSESPVANEDPKTDMRLLFVSHSARALLLFPLLALSEKVISSTALEECQDNSTFTASLFNIVFTPDNNSLALNVVGDSSSEGNVTLEVHAAAYGYTFLTESINPCTESGMSSLCPLQSLQINFDTTYPNISDSVIHRIPGIAYGIPDLDATVKVYMSMANNPKVPVACVLSRLSNGKTVYQAGVGWSTAVVAILGLLASALVSGLGHSNTASHVAVYALSLFNYFQSVAIIGLCAVPLPAIVQSWTQDFSWSMGIIRVSFLQKLATWYQLGTGGKPATILQTLGTKSVQVVKRSLESMGGPQSLVRRSQDSSVPSGEYVVKGIKRVAFRAGMEPTNLFLTGIIFFCIFVIFTTLGVTLFKEICALAIRAKWMKSDRFQTFLDDYLVTLKGIILRILLIGYPLLSILCLWEFTQVDSPAEVVLAVSNNPTYATRESSLTKLRYSFSSE
jgi:hypothetical protein